jgi:glutamate-ammonia-ligase adenylyltransferase
MQPLPGDDELRARWQKTLGAIDPAERASAIRRFQDAEELKLLVEWVAANEDAGSESAGPAGGKVDPLRRLQQRLTLLAECAVVAAAAWTAPGAAPPVASGSKRKRATRAKKVADWVVLALGKLGGRELTVHSDLDLVLVYEGDPADSATFMAMQEMATSFERMLEEPTADGFAYHVDTRLRPEGKKGALSMPRVAFERYLLERAEIWERLAWTRYRTIAGSKKLAARVEKAVCAFVYGPWDPRIPAVMGDIRRRMERELTQPGGPHLEMKIGRGGLADIDFLVEMIQMREGAERLELRVPGTRAALDRIGSTPWIEPQELADLESAHRFLRCLELYARLDVDAGTSAVPAEAERLEVLGRRLGLEAPAGERLAETFAEITGLVRSTYEAVLARLLVATSCAQLKE